MARIRNQKRDPSAKPSHRTKSAANAKPTGDSGHENLVTEAHETNDPNLAVDVSTFLQDLRIGPSEKRRDEKPKGDAATRATEKSESKGRRSTDKSKKPAKKASKETEADAEVTLLKPTQPRSSAKFIFPPTSQWYSVIPPLPPSTNSPTPTPTQVSSLLSKAKSLHTTDVQNYASSGVSTGSASESQFLQKVLQSGTLSDRLSAMTLLVQGSPVHNLRSLESLKSTAERGKGKGGREESLKALRCIVDWWIGGGVPDRKLKYFLDQPVLHSQVTDQCLLAWYFEDWLKKYFFSVLQVLENLLQDPLPYVRTQATSLAFTLLRDKPEQEQNLLRLLVNKLGDLEKPISSRVSHYLLQLLQTHPSMKGIVVREVVSLILKPRASTATASSILPSEPIPAAKSTKIVFSDAPSTSTPNPPPKSSREGKKAIGTSHSRYYAAITFNQIVLSPSQADRDVARELINIYFELFKDVLGQAETASNDMGVCVSKTESVKDVSKRKSKKQKGRKVEGDAGFTELEDSNSKLISAVLTGVNRALPFAKLDADDPRFKKNLDTLFLITHKSTFNITLQALLLIHQISATMSSTSSSSAGSVTDRFYRTLYASLYDPRLSTSSKQAMYLNLLFKCIKSDNNLERAKAFVRRFIQILASGGGGGAEFTAGGLHLLGELFSTVPGLREMLRVPVKRVPSSQHTGGEEDDKEQLYDPRKREPEFAHASSSPLWELLPLLSHYHPTVSLHARQLLSSQPLTSTPDLALNTLSHFLDRFVYKNPKKQGSKQKGSSAMQPAAGDAISGGGVRLIRGEVGDGFGPNSGRGVTVNDEKWWKRRVEDVPIDQVFFHKYFNQKNELEKARMAKAKKKKKGKGGGEECSDVESDEGGEDDREGDVGDTEGLTDDEEEAEVWTVMKASMPKELDISDDEGSIPPGLDEDDDGDSPTNLQDSEDSGDDAEEPSEVCEDDGDDQLSLAESSNAEDLIPLDEAEALAFRDGLIDWPADEGGSSDGEIKDEEWGGFGDGSPASGKKRKWKGGAEGQKKRKRVRSLPTFASYEDYAKLIEEGPDDDV